MIMSRIHAEDASKETSAAGDPWFPFSARPVQGA
jgi:hypothetical protein